MPFTERDRKQVHGAIGAMTSRARAHYECEACGSLDHGPHNGSVTVYQACLVRTLRDTQRRLREAMTELAARNAR
jgi:hypothetical protein